MYIPFQLAFWRKYLAVYKYVDQTAVRPGTYVQNRRTHSNSVCGPSPTAEVISRLAKSPPSAPDFNDDECVENHGNATGGADPCLRRLSELDEITDVEEVKLSVKEEDELIIETTYGALFSHLWWTLWSLIQSEISSINFGFIEYAESRMTAYYKMKRSLPPSEFPNGEVPTFELANLKLNGDLDSPAHGKSTTNGNSNGNGSLKRHSSANSGFYVTEEYE